MQEFKLPDLGEGMQEAEIRRWLIQPGDTIKLDQPMVEVETDKAVVEIPSPFAGRVAEIRVSAGQVAKLGEVLVTLDPSSSSSPPATPTTPVPNSSSRVPAASTSEVPDFSWQALPRGDEASADSSARTPATTISTSGPTNGSNIAAGPSPASPPNRVLAAPAVRKR